MAAALIVALLAGVLLVLGPTAPAAQEQAAPSARSRPAPASPPAPGAQASSAAPATQQSVSAEPQVLLVLVDPDEKVYVWGTMRVQFSIVNGSVPSGIGAKSLRLSIPSALAIGPPGVSTIELLPKPVDLRVPGERRDFAPAELRGSSFRELPWWRVLASLAYRPRKEVVFATLEYEGLSDRKPGTRTARLVVNVAAHPLGMYAGAVAGSFLGALFLLLYRFFNGAANAGAGAPAAVGPASLGAAIGESLLRFARGIVTTAIALFFIFQTNSELSLPINITIQDFYGGVILGLFGDKVGAAIVKRLKGP